MDVYVNHKKSLTNRSCRWHCKSRKVKVKEARASVKFLHLCYICAYNLPGDLFNSSSCLPFIPFFIISLFPFSM